MCSVNSNLKTETRCMCNNTTKFNTVIKSCCIVSLLLLASLDVQSQDICDRSISGRIINKETKVFIIYNQQIINLRDSYF